MQLDKLRQFVLARKAVADTYNSTIHFEKGLIEAPVQTGSTNYRYVVRINPNARDFYRARLWEENIMAECPLMEAPQLKKGEFPNAYQLVRESLSLPIYPSLSARSIHRVVGVVNSVTKEVLEGELPRR